NTRELLAEKRELERRCAEWGEYRPQLLAEDDGRFDRQEEIAAPREERFDRQEEEIAALREELAERRRRLEEMEQLVAGQQHTLGWRALQALRRIRDVVFP